MHYNDNIGDIGNVFIHKSRLASTNQYAKELLTTKTPPKEGTVVITDFQTAGIGQHDSSWYSEAGKSATMSVILYPDFLPLRRHYSLSMMTAISTYAVCKKYIKPNNLSIKWPNDIYIGNKKVGGILIQTSLKNSSFNYAIAGIGVNIKKFTNHTDELGLITYLEKYSKESINTRAFANELCKSLNHYYSILKNKNYNNLTELYYSVMYKKDEKITYYDRLKEKFGSGIIRGVTKEGKLIVEEKEKIKHFALKSITYPYEK